MAVFSSTNQLHQVLSQLMQVCPNVRHLSCGRLFESIERRQVDVSSTKINRAESIKEPECHPECIKVLASIDLDPITLNQRQLKPHWRHTYKSEETFEGNLEQKNSTAFELSIPLQDVCSVVLGTRQSLLNQHLVRNAIYQQLRGFKTKRSTATGISSGTTAKLPIGRIDKARIPASAVASDADSVLQRFGLNNKAEDEKGLNKILRNTTLTEQEERELKIAFADGYHGNWKKMSDPNKLVGKDGSMLVRAFAEGYVGSMRAVRPERKPRIGSTLFSLFLTTALIVSIILLTSNISIRKVQLFNGEQYEVNPEHVSVTFDDVRGSDEAKDELKNVVDFLKNPQKYTALGAKLPNGCLLVGPPGVGKTLLARAVAGEAGVPFFQVSGAEFDEVFVGTGAKRVRQLFKAAKSKAPCVIFIDEIDSVGGKRTSSEMHPYANQTINQLLTEMDGFQANEGVIVLGATNKRENLDKALLRPGRFDVEVAIGVPDLLGRQEILSLYLPKLKTDGKVDILGIAKRTTGCTGADIYNIVNHAAMKAATDGKHTVTMKEIDYAIDKVLMGPQKKRLAEPIVNRCTAYHEAGHALVKFYCGGASKLHKITILPRGLSLGMTHFIHDEKREFQSTKEDMIHDLDGLMGGRVAEEITFGEDQVSTGSSNDMQSATRIVEGMVKRFGFSDKAGLRVYPSTNTEPISTRIQEEIDDEIRQILKESYDRTKKLLIAKRKELILLAEALYEYEELTYDEAKIVIEGGKISRELPKPKPPQESPPPDDKGTPNKNSDKKEGSLTLLASRKY